MDFPNQIINLTLDRPDFYHGVDQTGGTDDLLGHLRRRMELIRRRRGRNVNDLFHAPFEFLDAANGEILWKVVLELPEKTRQAGRDLINCVTPLYQDGMVYFTAGYDYGGKMIKMAPDLKSAEVVWSDQVLDVHHGGVVLINGYIYGANWLNNGNGNWRRRRAAPWSANADREAIVDIACEPNRALRRVPSKSGIHNSSNRPGPP